MDGYFKTLERLRKLDATKKRVAGQVSVMVTARRLIIRNWMGEKVVNRLFDREFAVESRANGDHIHVEVYEERVQRGRAS